MKLDEFISRVFDRFPPELRGNETQDSLMIDYIKALDTGFDYNYEAAYIELMRSYSFKKLPPASLLLNTLNSFKIQKKLPPLVYDIVYAYHPKYEHWYCYGIEPHIGETGTRYHLSRMGFTEFRKTDPYAEAILQKYGGDTQAASLVREVCR